MLPLLLMAVMMRCFIRSRCCICLMRLLICCLQSLQLILGSSEDSAGSLGGGNRGTGMARAIS